MHQIRGRFTSSFLLESFSQGESEVEVQQCPLPTRPLQGNRLAGGRKQQASLWSFRFNIFFPV